MLVLLQINLWNHTRTPRDQPTGGDEPPLGTQLSCRRQERERERELVCPRGSESQERLEWAERMED